MRVLVVDDNRDLLESMAMVLGFLGHEVLVADNGVDALTRIEAERPEVVFLDVGMPGMSGYEVVERARRLPAGAHTRVVAMTGWGRDEDRDRAIASGFDLHVVKPLDLGALTALLKTFEGHARHPKPPTPGAATPEAPSV